MFFLIYTLDIKLTHCLEKEDQLYLGDVFFILFENLLRFFLSKISQIPSAIDLDSFFTTSPVWSDITGVFKPSTSETKSGF